VVPLSFKAYGAYYNILAEIHLIASLNSQANFQASVFLFCFRLYWQYLDLQPLDYFCLLGPIFAAL